MIRVFRFIIHITVMDWQERSPTPQKKKHREKKGSESYQLQSLTTCIKCTLTSFLKIVMQHSSKPSYQELYNACIDLSILYITYTVLNTCSKLLKAISGNL